MSGNAVEQPNVDEIMRRIRADIRAAVERGECGVPAYDPITADPQAPATPVLYSEDLNAMNKEWHNWYAPVEITSHRSVVGRFIVKAKRFVVDAVWTYLFKDYLEREKGFHMHLVRFLNATARYIDSRVAEIFWQVVRKVDGDVTGMNERVDRLFDQADATLRAVEKGIHQRLLENEAKGEAQRAQLETLLGRIGQIDDVTRGLERTVALVSRTPAAAAGEAGVPAPSGFQARDGVDYLLLENRYRGAEELIRERLQSYVALYRGAAGPVLDIGCGRGEFLELLREAGIAARGVDLDDAMIARCAQKGLDVRKADALAMLRELPDHSLGGVFAAQVIEHLTNSQLRELVALCARKIVPGGKMAFETINPQSVTALARNFFRDPSHVWPLHPDTMRFVLEMCGVRTDDVLYRSPFPPEAALREIALAPYVPARWHAVLKEMNDNVRRLNDLLFGFQDYCIVGSVPAESRQNS